MKKFRALLLVILILNCLYGQANEYGYNCTVFPTLERNFEQCVPFMEKGGRAFLFNLKEKNKTLYVTAPTGEMPFNQILASIAGFSKQQPSLPFTLILTGKCEANLLLTSFREARLMNDIYFKTGGEWPKPSEICRKGKHFLVFTQTRLPKPFIPLNEYSLMTSYFRLNVSENYASWFVNKPTNDLMIYYPYNSPRYSFENLSPIPLKKNAREIHELLARKKTVLEMSFEIWTRSGRVPNFLICDINQADECFKTANTINSTPKNFFEVQDSGNPLTEVHWTGRDSLITSGFFSLPAQFLKKLKPYKNEYTFSPDVLLIDLINSNETNTFLAFKEKEDNTPPILGMDFIHDRFTPSEKNFNFGNTLRTDSGLSLNGKVAFVDCGNNYSINNEKPISISAKIFPRSFNSYRVILSKNFSFSLKLYNRAITFTTPEVGVTDYYAKNKELDINKWSHIVVVFRPNNSISFYLNGQLIDTQKAYNFQTSQNTLMIGSNEKGRYFNGIIKDVFVWNRALREEEITALYNDTHPIYKTDIEKYGWYLLLILPAVIFFGAIRRKRKPVILRTISDPEPLSAHEEVIRELKTPGNGTEHCNEPESVQTQSPKSRLPQVNFFGNVQIMDGKGENKIGLFPPKILQLFVLISCNSLQPKNGITSKEICQILWENYEPEKAENNRKYSLNKLRQILEDLNLVKLVYDDKCWHFVFDPGVSFDYQQYQLFISKGEKCDAQDIAAILPVLKKGPFLNSIKAECFDSLKNSISNQIIDLMLLLAEKTSIKTDTKICIEIAKTIFVFDDVNEEANALLIHSLLAEGKNSLAHKAYEQFTKRYADLLGEEYKISFQSLCK